MDQIPTVGIITVLSVELDAICDLLTIGKNKMSRKAKDKHIYYETIIQSRLYDIQFRTVIHATSRAGNKIAAERSEWLIETFSPQCLILAGISAGIKNKVKIGDVIWARNVVNGEMSVAEKDKQRPRPEILYMPEIMFEMLHSLHGIQTAHSQLFKRKYNAKLEPQKNLLEEDITNHVSYPPKVLDASIYSSNTLLKDPKALASIRDNIDDQVKAAEMEAGGMVTTCTKKNIPWLVIRSVTDFGDDFKDDRFHKYASVSAACFLRRFLTHGLDWSCLLNNKLSNVRTIKKKTTRRKTNIKIVGFRLAAKPIVGRQSTIATLAEYSKTSSFAIRGIKGIGKSKVLSALVDKIIVNDSSRFDWCYWVRFEYGAPTPFISFAKKLIFDITGVELIDSDSTQEQLAANIVEILRSNKCLLIIDQFESIIDRITRSPVENGYSYLLRSARGGLEPGCLIVTSWETPIDCEGVEFPDWELKGLDVMSSLSLLENTMNKNNKGSEVSNSFEASEYVQLIGGHPLAIELLSTNYSFVLQPHFFNQDNLGKPIEEIATDVIQYLYRRIPFTDTAIQILDTIAISKVPISIDMLSSITGIIKNDISLGVRELCKRSFLYKVRDCYDAHSLVRQYVSSLQSTEKQTTIHKRFADIYFNEGNIRFCRSLLDKLNSLVMATNHLIDATAFEDALYYFYKFELDLLLYNHGDHDRLLGFISIFLKNKPKPIQEVKLLGLAARLYRDRDQPHIAAILAENALKIARTANDNTLLVEALVNAGDIQYYCEDNFKAETYLNEAISKTNCHIPLSISLRAYGCMGNVEKDKDKAIAYYEKAIELALKTKDYRYAGIWKGDLALLYLDKDGEEYAENLFIQAIEHAKQAEDPMNCCHWLGHIANLRWNKNKRDIAVQNFYEAIASAINRGYIRVARIILSRIYALHIVNINESPLSLVLSKIVFSKKDHKKFSWLAEQLGTILTEKAIVFEKQNKFEDAIEEYTIYIKIPILEPFLLEKRAKCYRILAYTSNDASTLLDKAAADYRRVHHLMPDREHNLLFHAATLSQKGVYPQAIKMLDSLLDRNPSFSLALLTKAEIQLLIDAPSEALVSTQEVINSQQSEMKRCVGLCLQCWAKILLGLPCTTELIELENMNVKLSTHKDWCLVELKTLEEKNRNKLSTNDINNIMRIDKAFKSKFIDLDDN